MAIKTLLIICREAVEGRTESQVAEAAETGVLIIDNPKEKPMEELVKVILLEGEPSFQSKTTTAPTSVSTEYDSPDLPLYSPEAWKKQLEDFHKSVGQT